VSYLLRINDHLNKGGPDYFYRVELTPVAPYLALKIPDVSRNNAQERKSIVVPRGNRFGMLVSVERKDFRRRTRLASARPAERRDDAIAKTCRRIRPCCLSFSRRRPTAPIAGKLCDLVAKTCRHQIRIFPANCIRTSRLCAVSRAIRFTRRCRAQDRRRRG